MKTERCCAACRAKGEAKEMIRIALSEGEAHVDPRRRCQSRGVNLCADMRCFDKLAKRRMIAKRLGIEAIDEDKTRELRDEFQKELAVREECE